MTLCSIYRKWHTQHYFCSLALEEGKCTLHAQRYVHTHTHTHLYSLKMVEQW